MEYIDGEVWAAAGVGPALRVGSRGACGWQCTGLLVETEGVSPWVQVRVGASSSGRRVR